jgi:putative transcriptional regulator
MKIKSESNLERIAKAIEDDAGHDIPSIRDALREVRDGNFSASYSREQLLVRAARNKTGLSQAGFADAINTPVRTLQEWEQGRSSPPGAAVKLFELIVSNPQLIVSAG